MVLRVCISGTSCYYERVRKVFGFTIVIIFFLLSLGLFFNNKLYAQEQGCQLKIDPKDLASNSKGPITITSTIKGCLNERETNYRVIALPQGMSLKDAEPSTGIGGLDRDLGTYRYLWDKAPVIQDSNTIIADFQYSFDDVRSFIGDFLNKYRSENPTRAWAILVCVKEGNTCSTTGTGIINVGKVTPALTATPTPQEDQPIFDLKLQSQCTFGRGEDIPLIVDQNIQPDHTYHWWFSEIKDKRGIIKSGPTGPGRLSFTIPENQARDIKTTEKKPEGYLVCVDIDDKTREGTNCIRLFFKAYNPKAAGLDVSCSERNAGNITPTPESPLPPCLKWVNSIDGSPIDPQVYTDPSYKDRKCAEISTGIGPISTDPFQFVKSALSILLSVSGGITVIFIIVSGYQLMISRGNPEAIKEAQEKLTAAIVGFLFIIFSLVILEVIGVNILHIPGFSK